MVSGLRLQDILQMPAADKDRLHVIKWIGTVPAVAVCTKCPRLPSSNHNAETDSGRSGKVKIQFDRHKCESVSEHAA